jgi:hypothetical protein
MKTEDGRNLPNPIQFSHLNSPEQRALAGDPGPSHLFNCLDQGPQLYQNEPGVLISLGMSLRKVSQSLQHVRELFHVPCHEQSRSRS